MSKQTTATFHTALWSYYDRHGRHDLPWRLADADGTYDPYKILVSEIMLQQTQVPRVITKYGEFLELFPDVQALAVAPLGQVLTAWSGLGYNRRAKFLWQTAQAVVADHQAEFPYTLDALLRLPGVGQSTAGAIMAYAYDQPVIFIETNVRTVYIHHFFPDRQGITDLEIRELIEQTLISERPREFYWALMDYGTHLKATVGNLNTASTVYSRQSPFAGSRRQVRGKVIRLLTAHQATLPQLQAEIHDERLVAVLADLLQEQMIVKKADSYRLS